MREQMARLKIDYEFFDAVDGDKLSIAYINKFKIKEGEQHISRPLSEGELGCAFSHLHVYEKMLAENIEKLIVLEDDAQLNDDFVVLINNLNSAPLKGDLTYIGYLYFPCAAPFFGKHIYPISLWESRTLPIPPAATSTKYRIGPLITGVWGTHAYAITKKGAEQLIQQIKGGPFIPADDRLAISGIKQRFAIAPITVRQWKDGNIEQHIAPDRDVLDQGKNARNALRKLRKSHRSLKYRIPKFIIKCLQKIYSLAPVRWEVARGRIRNTRRLIKSKKIT